MKDLNHRKARYFYVRWALMICCIGIGVTSQSQSYFVPYGGYLLKYHLSDIQCTVCGYQEVGFSDISTMCSTFTPEGDLYVLANEMDQALYLMDTSTAAVTLVMPLPAGLPVMRGIAAAGGGIFYTFPIHYPNYETDSLYRWDINTSTVTSVGLLNYPPSGDILAYYGEFYYLSKTSWVSDNFIVRLNTTDPGNSELVCTIPYPERYYFLTATDVPNMLIGVQLPSYFSDKIATVDLTDCTSKRVCDGGNYSGFLGHVSTYEYSLDTPAENEIDLDCNNDSGATGADFNGGEFDCLNNSGELVSDEDIKILVDSRLQEMVIQIANPLDGQYEILDMSGTAPLMMVTGQGTHQLTLTNAGSARKGDFESALKLVTYFDLALSPTAGIREIHVQFTTEIGTSSNIAKAYIQVNAIEQIPLDLGSDVELCQEASYTINSDVALVEYMWSTGAVTPSIQVTDEGEYSLTVSSSNRCPNADTVEIMNIPNLMISLIGDESICFNGEAALTLIADGPLPYTIEISADPGSVFTFDVDEATFSFSDFPFDITEYSIVGVTTPSSVCVNLIDDEQIIEIYPNYTNEDSVGVCDGDSILLGQVYYSDPGEYGVYLTSIHGCDSLVNYHLSALSTAQIEKNIFTCDSSAIGVFVSYLSNQTGCDTILTTLVSLMTSDTTDIQQTTCRNTNAGIFIETLNDTEGCDSVVITRIDFIPPTDTTYTVLYSCDPDAWGQEVQTLVSMGGCDSIVVKDIIQGSPIVTGLSLTSCDSSTLGVFEDHYVTAQLCDSIVITTITFSLQDTTVITGTTCNPQEAGQFINTYTNMFGCDSQVIQVIMLLPENETQITSTTCDPTNVGLFEYHHINQFGCDSVVFETVNLQPSNELVITEITCDPDAAGTIISVFSNQHGCDSTVIYHLLFILPDTTIVQAHTCDSLMIGTAENLWTNKFGCDSLVITHTTLHNLPEVVISTSVYNGFQISCHGGNDGAIAATASGISPLTFQWSNGETGENIQDLEEGDYSITVTDAYGCIAEKFVTLHAPDSFYIHMAISHPGCFMQDSGTIIINPAGGIEPWRFSLNNGPYQESGKYSGLTSGTYLVSVFDDHDCEVKEIVILNSVPVVEVELGGDQTILEGNSTTINALVSASYDSLASIVWTGLEDPACPTCLTQNIAPVITSLYTISVINEQGCADQDSLLVTVVDPDDIYIPNIFSPNGDQVNDLWIISAGDAIEEIISLAIFDRWGNVVYEAERFSPNDPSYGWDGYWNAKKAQAGVYVFQLIFDYRYIEGLNLSPQQRTGSLTLIR